MLGATQRFWTNVFMTSLAPAIWGTTYIVTTELLPPGRPFIAALLRTFPAGILLVLFIRNLPKQNEWSRLVALSALNIGFFQALLFIAAYRLPGGLAAVVGATQPLLVMGLVWVADQQRPSRLAVWSGIVGIIGMAVLLLSPEISWDLIGFGAALGGAACMATGTYLTHRWRTKMPILAFTGWQLLIGGIVLAPVAWIVDTPLPALSLVHMLGYSYLSIVGALLAYVLWFRGLQRLPPVAVSSLGLLSPLMAVLLGWVILGQEIMGMSLVGLIAVFFSILSVQWSSRLSKEYRCR